MNLHILPTSYPINSRAAAYGDGCFTTMLLENGSIQHQKQHFERLRYSCQRLDFPEFNIGQFATATTKFLAEHHARIANKAVLKALVTVSGGGRGYSRSDDAELDIYMSVHDYPQHYPQWQQNGISLGVASLTLGKQPLLSGLKHLNRLEQVLIKQEKESFIHTHNSQRIGIDDVIVCDAEGMMVETSTANLFWRKHKHWYTPCLDDAGVAGVIRGVIANYFNEQGVLLNHVREPVLSLLDADEVIICNSILGIAPVKNLIYDKLQTGYDISQATIQYSDLNS